MAIAIATSKAGPCFFMSAGAKLTVTEVLGKEKPEFLIAARTRSLASLTEASGRPTIVNLGRPGETSASTFTGKADRPNNDAEKTLNDAIKSICGEQLNYVGRGLCK